VPVAASGRTQLRQTPLGQVAPPTSPPPEDPEGIDGLDGLDEIELPSAADRHLLSRFSFGITPSLVAASADAGGARRWFDDQLEPGEIADGPAVAIADWWPTLADSFRDKHADDVADRIPGFDQDLDFVRWTLMHRITTRRQVLAVMTDFWSNMLFIPAPSTKTYEWRPDFERVVRARALGSFTDLLTAAVLHPAMLVSLDNADSTASAPNENLGRELLELHTVGRDAAYTEEEVRDSMRILTGFRVAPNEDCEPYYSPDDHATGRVSVLGFEHPNSSPDGRAVTKAYLAHLASHRATATRIAERLVCRFVADDPPAGIVKDVADAYLDSDTDIKKTLRALVDHPAFRSAAEVKVRTPVEDFVNTYRVLQVEVEPPTKEDGNAATAMVWICGSMGQRPYNWPRPDGFPEAGESWSSASRMLGSWRVHRNTAGGLYPRVGIGYRDPDYWLPSLPARFDDVVKRMCRLLLAQDPSDQMIDTACKAIDASPSTTVDEDSPIARWKVPLVLLALLDTPEHMSR
jgi:uncharacterized protein (DUF1800 family)